MCLSFDTSPSHYRVKNQLFKINHEICQAIFLR